MQTKESTAIDMPQPAATMLKKTPSTVEEIGSQDFVVTLSSSPPPPPYQAMESKLGSEAKQRGTHQRRKKTRRKRKAEMPPLKEEHEEDEECLLLLDEQSSMQDSRLEGSGVVTLTPEGSHDLLCDLSPSSSSDEESPVSTDQTPNSSRELYSASNKVAKS